MNRLVRIISLTLFMICSGVQAWEQPFDIRGELLVLQPLIDQSFYAQEIANSFPGGTRFDNPFHYTCAYRLYGSYAFCDHDLQFIWTHLPKTSQSDSVSGVLQASSGLIGNIFSGARSKVELEYFAADALIGWWGNQCNAFRFVLRTGLHYANFRFKEKLEYTGAFRGSDIHTNRNHTWGIGPEIVFETNYDLNFLNNCSCGNFSLTSMVKGGLLASRYTVNFARSTPFSIAQPHANDNIFWQLVPMWDIRIGLSYSYEFACFKTLFELGYEMLSYHDAIDRVFFTDNIALSNSLDVYSDANFQGPYVALEFIF